MDYLANITFDPFYVLLGLYGAHALLSLRLNYLLRRPSR